MIDGQADTNIHGRGETALNTLLDVYLRLLSIVFLIFTLGIWGLAVGLVGDPSMRFDTMTAEMRIYVAVLGVLNPVTSVGLWTTLSWGRVVWFMSIAFQLGFSISHPGIVGELMLVIIFHAVCVAVYLIFQILLRRIANKE